MTPHPFIKLRFDSWYASRMRRANRSELPRRRRAHISYMRRHPMKWVWPLPSLTSCVPGPWMALVTVQRSPTPSTTSSSCVSVSFLSISTVCFYLLNDFIHVRAIAAASVFTRYAHAQNGSELISGRHGTSRSRFVVFKRSYCSSMLHIFETLF